MGQAPPQGTCMRCSECLSDNVAVHEYDFGICPETGYHDAGERFRCHGCGATGDADDLVDHDGSQAETQAISSPAGRAHDRPAQPEVAGCRGS